MEEERSDHVGHAITVAVSHLFLVAVLVVFCSVRVPHYMDVYQDVNAELPAMTKIVLNVGHWIALHWYWLAIPFLAVLVGDMAVFVLISRRKNESFARVWAWAVIGFLGIILAGSWLAVRLPLSGLTRGMPQ
jgi:type II secretory pathway component PulF